MLGFDVFVVVPNLGQVFVVIASGIEDSLNAAIPFLVVDEAKNDGYIGTLSDDIEAFFPMLYGFSGAFRTNHELCVFVLAEHVNHLLHEVVLVPAIDWNAADFLQKPANARLEELLFDHHLKLDAVVPIVGQADKEILDGGMRCHDADGIAEVLWGLVDGLPTAKFES